jgi:cytochrome c553
MISTLLHSLSIVFICFFSLNNGAYAADIEKGKNKATFCLHCHGANGNSKSPQYPSLAGQRAAYLEAQLNAFQSGQRTTDTVMQDQVAKLSKEDISNISAYFSSLSSESADGGNKSLAKQGQNKFAMCAGCHGQSAQGRASFPKLAGQQAEYLEKQLQNFKSRSRKGGPMNAIASSLSDQDIKEIAAFLNTL